MGDGRQAGGHPGGHSGGHPGGDPHAVFHRQYAQGAPWDIGRPQPAYAELEEAGAIGARVLELGCGRGDLSIYLALRGHIVTGIDVVGSAIEAARVKAVESALSARFEVGDVLELLEGGSDALGDPFNDVVDVGFFHALSDGDRDRLSHALAPLLVPEGAYRFLCFSDKVPGAWGPRRVSEAEIRETFARPEWRVASVETAELHSARPEMPVVSAWLATIERV